jgi:mRNA interferase RelE/StbE
MEFHAEYSAEALMQLQTLDKMVAKRIINKVEQALANPRHFIESLTGRPELKLRVGDYRLIVVLDERNRILFIRSIGHRRDVYRKH